ncbi:hypothetical protein BH24DEI2_BH24DEI2_03900 [soil metagenome]
MNKKGMTVIEAIVAIAILSIVMAAVLPAFMTFAQTNQRSELRSGAVIAAQQVMDTMRRVQDTDFVGTHKVDSGLRTYDVTTSICAPGSAGCLSTQNAKHIRLEVQYAGKTYYSVETVFTQLD